MGCVGSEPEGPTGSFSWGTCTAETRSLGDASPRQAPPPCFTRSFRARKRILGFEILPESREARFLEMLNVPRSISSKQQSWVLSVTESWGQEKQIPVAESN